MVDCSLQNKYGIAANLKMFFKESGSTMEHLILVGYRGTGKTTVARLLSDRLGIPAVDGDPEIVRRAGKSIAEIFDRDGEVAFRDLEETVIAELLAGDGSQTIVLATGGGAVLRPETRRRLRRAGHVVWLTASPETILARLQGDVNSSATRPSLTGLPPLEEILAMLEHRHGLYEETAHAVVDTDGRTVEEIVEEIIGLFHEFTLPKVSPMTASESRTDIHRYMDELRREVDVALDASAMFGDGCPSRLSEAIRYSLLAPGKRLRPLLVLLGCELLGGDRRRAMPAACAVEMIHAYSLIHDDLPAMDDDDLRRGRPTCHKQFDEPTAILAGDSLLPLAFEMIGRLEPAETAGRCCTELAVASGPCRLVGGQMDDVAIEKGLYSSGGDWRNAPEKARELMEKIHLRKTGALMRVSLRLGGIVAGASEGQLDLLDDFGVNFGLAFQITDDLLDVLGDEGTVGKRLRKDAEKNKWSYPTLLGVDESRKEAEAFVRKAVACLESLDRHDSTAFGTLRGMTEELLGRNK